MSIGSLVVDFLTLRLRAQVAGHMPEEPTETSTEQEHHSCEGGTDYLQRKNSGARIDVCVCRLGKGAEHGQHLNYGQRKSQRSV